MFRSRNCDLKTLKCKQHSYDLYNLTPPLLEERITRPFQRKQLDIRFNWISLSCSPAENVQSQGEFTSSPRAEKHFKSPWSRTFKLSKAFFCRTRCRRSLSPDIKYWWTKLSEATAVAVAAATAEKRQLCSSHHGNWTQRGHEKPVTRGCHNFCLSVRGRESNRERRSCGPVSHSPGVIILPEVSSWIK